VPDPWRFQLHAEVIALVVFLTGSYVYLVRSIGPAAVRAGEPPITRRNIWSFVGAIVMLFAASWWPLHDIGEQYLYSAHMLQHMMLSYFLPPLVWMATPEWLLRSLIGRGRLYHCVRWLCHPVVAAVIFNVSVMLIHVPGVVSASVENGAVHYLLHVMVVTTALLMWMPVVGPIPEFRIGTAPAMIYLFLQSVVPTVPAAWLTFAEGAVYHTYGDQPLRLWGLSVTSDQQLAGAIMKTGGSIFLWTIIVTMWFTRFSASYRTEHDYRRPVPPAPESGAPGAAEPVLTFADVEREFAATPAVREP
jgi:putative membrane protein